MTSNHSDLTPFFIVGCGRSGSTLLQTLIDAHPNIAIPPESHIYNRFGGAFEYYGDLSIQRHRRRFIDDLLNDVFVQMWNLDISVEDVEQAASSSTRAGIIEALFSLYARSNGARRWGEKTPEHIRWLPLIREDFPDARLIHLVRDGRDVAEAFQRMIYGPVSALGLGEEWRRDVMYWRDYQNRIGSENMLLVKYEHLVETPEKVLKDVIEFIGEPFIDTTDDYADTGLSDTYSTQSWHTSLRKEITTDKIGVYRRRFSERQIETFEYIAGDALKAYGYTPDYKNPREPSVGYTVYASIMDRVVRWYRKLFDLKVVRWDYQSKLRKMLRRIEWMISFRRH